MPASVAILVGARGENAPSAHYPTRALQAGRLCAARMRTAHILLYTTTHLETVRQDDGARTRAMEERDGGR